MDVNPRRVEEPILGGWGGNPSQILMVTDCIGIVHKNCAHTVYEELGLLRSVNAVCHQAWRKSKNRILGNFILCIRKLRVFENMVLRRIFGPRRDEVKGEWRRLHNEELNGMYSSPNIVRVIKSRRMRWAGHEARMGGNRCAQGVGGED